VKRVTVVAAVSLVFTYLFFLEYLPPFHHVHIPFDLEAYHYPLADYAFQSIHAGRFPQWDAAIYCGQTFVGNVQVALFYPATWVMFAANWGREHVTYQSLEDLVFAHVWLAFILCYLWLLRGRGLGGLASILGAGVFAFGGYLLLQLQHMGQVIGYAWFPLGAWGIDQAIADSRVTRLWKLAAASALIFLAGYPPLWFVFAVSMGTYVLFRNWKWTPGVVAALLFSIALAAVQFLPAWEARALKNPENKYGSGIKELIYFVSYIVPNYFDFGMNVPVLTNLRKEYLYLGAPGIAGLLLLLRRRTWLATLPFLAILAVSLIALTNPYDIVWNLVKNSTLLSDLCRSWNFLAGISFALAPLAAIGLDDFLQRSAAPSRNWLTIVAIALLVAWATWELLHFPADLAHGWAAAIPTVVMLGIFVIALVALRSADGRTRTILATALLLGVAVDYKVFGTSKRFNAAPQPGSLPYTTSTYPAMEDASYLDIQAHRDYRVLLDLTGPFPPTLRHIGLRTPQGFDPFFTRQYRELLGEETHFRTAWEFEIAPDQTDLLQLFGVRYLITSEMGPLYARVLASPDFRQNGKFDRFYKVFEYRDAHPPYGMEGDPAATRQVAWTPERRDFEIHSASGGRFILAEQLFPGWSAEVDGKSVPIARWRGAFQAIYLSPGDHQVHFQFASPGFRKGLWISLASLLALLCALTVTGIRARP
jgi:hypothetical protein